MQVAAATAPNFGSRWSILHQEKNAKATSVAMMEATAVANAEVQADFR